MEDERIVELYWERSETAISETAAKYGRYCHTVAFHILHSNEDAEECVNDTYWRAWGAMPPHRPAILATFLGKITRRLALNRWEQYTAEKRGGGQVPVALSELEDCLSTDSVEKVVEDQALANCLTTFLRGLPQEERMLFVRRYWYLCPVKDLATQFGKSESSVKTTLFRTRNKLKCYLEKEA